MSRNYLSISIATLKYKRKTVCACTGGSKLVGLTLMEQRRKPTLIKQKKSSVVCFQANLVEA